MRIRGSLLRLGLHLLVLSVLFMAVAPLPVQAQALEEDFVGVYRSEAMDNELTDDTIVWQLSLLPDQSAEAMIVFVTRDSVNFEVGRWVAKEDGSLGVTMERRFDHQGGREHAIEPPFEIEFAVDGDTLTAADYLYYGPHDLILTRVDEDPVSVLDENGDLVDELKTGLSEYPDSLYLGTYRTEDFMVEDSEQWIAIDIQADGRAFLEYAPIPDLGATSSRARWRNNGDGTLSVEIEADFDAAGEVVQEYDPPEPFSDLERLSSGGLVIRDILLPDGGQLIFSRTETITDTAEIEPEVVPSATGLYGGGLVIEDAPVIGLLFDLHADGTVQVVAAPFDGESEPMVTTGIWEQTELTVTVTLSSETHFESGEAVVGASTLSEPEIFVLEEGNLVGAEVTLIPLPVRGSEAESAAQPTQPKIVTPPPAPSSDEPLPDTDGATPVAEEDVTYMVGREQLVAGITVVLALNADGTASMSTQLGPDAGAMLELGAWEETADGPVVTFDRSGYDNVAYSEAEVLAFERTDTRTLTAIDYDAERYGEDLILYDTRDY